MDDAQRKRMFMLTNDPALGSLRHWLKNVIAFNGMVEEIASDGERPAIRLVWDSAPGQPYNRRTTAGYILCEDAVKCGFAIKKINREMRRRAREKGLIP